MVLFLTFAFLFVPAIAFADIKIEADLFKKDLISFHDKMVSHQKDVAEPSDTLTTGQAGELYIFQDISRAYLNYARFLIDEVELLKLASGNESVRGYIKNSILRFNKETEYYIGWLMFQIKFAKNLEMTKKLQILKEDIATFHIKIKKFSDDM